MQNNIMVRLSKCFVIIIASSVLFGCATVVQPNFSVPNVGLSNHKIEAEVKSLMVTIARPDEKTGDLTHINPVLVPDLWQKSLTEALNKMAIFQDDATKKVNISAKILSFEPDMMGFAMTTKTSARYEIVDRKTGDIIYTQDISSTGTCPADYAFAGAARVAESINRAVQNNITQFLQALESVDIQKPMFPTKSSAAK